MTRNQKRIYALIALVLILAVLSVYPQRTREYHITKKGPVVFIGQGFDGGFVEIKVGTTIFDNPAIRSPSNSYVSLPPHLHAGEQVRISGEWTATRPWWSIHRPHPPTVVKLTNLSPIHSKTTSDNT